MSKKKFLSLLIVLVAGLILVPATLVMGTSVTNVTVTVSPSTPCSIGQYTINFTTSASGALVEGTGKITIDFTNYEANGGDVPPTGVGNGTAGDYSTGDVTVNGVSAPSAYIIDVNAEANQVEIKTPVAIAVGASVTVIFNSSAEIVNPVAGVYTLTVKTTSDTGVVTSVAYVIGGAVGKAVSLYTDTGLFVNSYDTITEAVDAASADYTIEVAAGTYVEDLSITKSGLTLKSVAGAATTFIEGSMTLDPNADDFVLGGTSGHGFTLKKGIDYLIVLDRSDDVTISYNAFDTTRLAGQTQVDAIRIWQNATSGLTVTHNTFTIVGLFDMGVRGHTSGPLAGLTVTDNTFTGTDNTLETSAIQIDKLDVSDAIDATKDAVISGNEITGVTYGVAIGAQGGDLIGDGANATFEISDNTFDGLKYGVYLIAVPGANTDQDVDIEQNTFTGNTNGLAISVDGDWQPEDFTVKNNNFSGNTTAVSNASGQPNVPAQYNWWGATSGPKDPDENPNGGGDPTGIDVDVTPWLGSAYASDSATHTYYSIGVGGYHMVSTPFDPLAAPGTVATVYDELPGVTLYKWNPGLATPAYATFTGAATVASKWGYWLYLSGDKAITVEGTETALDTVFNFAKAGWYQISASYNFDWDEAAGVNMENAAGKLRIVSYDPATGIYGNHYVDQGYVGSAWYGYWVRATADSASLTLKKAALSDPPSPLSMMSAQRIPAGLEMPPAPPSFVPQGAIPEVKVELAVADGVVTFAASVGEALKVQVFNIGGGLVYEASADGSELTWTMQTSSGELVANGVYLAKVTVKTAAGWVDGGLFRILVLR